MTSKVMTYYTSDSDVTKIETTFVLHVARDLKL